MAKQQLAERYERHNREARGAGFAFEGDLRRGFFGTRIGTGKRVLDLGCRDGTMATAYVSGNSVTGLDIDRNALERAEAVGVGAVWADLTDPLPVDSASFDVVVAGEVLEHLPDPVALLEEVDRVLVPGGALLGSVPNAFRMKNRLRFLAGRPAERDPTHLQQYSPARLRRLLAAHFEEVEITFHASRFLCLSDRLFGNSMLFAGRKPHPPMSDRSG